MTPTLFDRRLEPGQRMRHVVPAEQRKTQLSYGVGEIVRRHRDGWLVKFAGQGIGGSVMQDNELQTIGDATKD